MRYLHIATGLLLGMTALPVLAQTPAGVDPATGARPGHTPGVGESLPRSNSASNIGAADSRSIVAPTLPDAGLSDAAATKEFLAAARTALVAGRTGQAQQALEMAETRALGRALFPTESNPASNPALVTQIRDARQALGAHDNSSAIRLIDLALAS